MDLSILSPRIYNAVSKCNLKNILEIRLRRDYHVKLNINNKYYYLTNEGVSSSKNFAIICEQADINSVINNVTERSIYAFNDKIKQGYITTKDGIRIGVAGECVFDNEKIVTIKNFTSLNIRLPHEQIGCANKLYKYVFNKKFYNTLIVSPPLYGKTTLLKDLIRKINNENDVSILVIDERCEFTNCKFEDVDLISCSNKTFAFNCGLRALAPNIVITDELSCAQDWLCAMKASKSGVKIIASMHGSSLNDVINNSDYLSGVFERIVVLKTEGQAGIIDKVYNEDYKEI